jgi:hypothetical protein
MDAPFFDLPNKVAYQYPYELEKITVSRAIGQAGLVITALVTAIALKSLLVTAAISPPLAIGTVVVLACSVASLVFSRYMDKTNQNERKKDGDELDELLKIESTDRVGLPKVLESKQRDYKGKFSNIQALVQERLNVLAPKVAAAATKPNTAENRKSFDLLSTAQSALNSLNFHMNQTSQTAGGPN